MGCVVLDEFHERHLEGDLALALLRRLQRARRPDLKIVVMSATLRRGADRGVPWRPRSRCPCFGRQAVSTRSRSSTRRIRPRRVEDQVAAALERLAARGHSGHVLVFLPGSFEIRRAQTACAPLARRHGWQLLPLYGDQSPEEQDRAVAPVHPNQDHPLHQRGGKFHHHRWRQRGDR